MWWSTSTTRHSRTPRSPSAPSTTPDRIASLPFPTVLTEKGTGAWSRPRGPLTIVEKEEIKTLIGLDFIVVCCGGGGIPVIREARGFSGVDAVIDKDLASARLAQEVGVDIFVIATDVEGVFLRTGSPERSFFGRLTLADAARYLKEGISPPGRWGRRWRRPSVLESGGRRAVITSIEAIEEAVEGRAGTEIVRGSRMVEHPFRRGGLVRLGGGLPDPRRPRSTVTTKSWTFVRIEPGGERAPVGELARRELRHIDAVEVDGPHAGVRHMVRGEHVSHGDGVGWVARAIRSSPGGQDRASRPGPGTHRP